MIRYLLPRCLIPLCMIAGALAAAPWLDSFPAGAIGVSVFGAAVLSPLVPAVAYRLGVHRFWLSLLVDVVCFLIYTLVVVLHSPLGFDALASGFYHGPSQILTFALPLVSPRSLFVAPVALAWLAGALAGECLTRRWFTVLPYPGFLVAYGLAYAATARADSFAGAHGRIDETILAAVLLVTLLLLRVAQTWVRQDETAESTQADGILPLRGVAVGAATTVVVAVVAALIAQSSAFGGRGAAAQRVPSVRDSRPLSPVAFISSLRPADPRAEGTPVFTVQTDRATSGYFAIANSDIYDGSGWSFSRTFRPSGGALPAESDTELDGPSRTVTQIYRIADGPLVRAPWMPYLYRPQQVTGAAINMDPASGMIVPAGALHRGERYRVSSQVNVARFAKLPSTAQIATGTASNSNLPAGVDQTLELLTRSFSAETATPLSPAVGFLQALQRDLREHYSLVGAGLRQSASGATRQPAVRTAPSRPTATTSSGQRAGSSSFADVLASVVGPDRAGTPEQYATLVALVARQLGVPARVVSGFRVRPHGDGGLLPSGTYTVTTAQAWTWVEIPVTGAGWVVLDAAPSTYSAAHQQQSVAASASPSPTAPPTQNALITKSNGGHAIAPKSSVGGPSASSVYAALVSLAVAVAALLVVLLGLLLARKPLRRRRRRGLAEPRARTVAAWREGIDALSEAGLPELGVRTGAEIVALAGGRFGADAAAHAAHLNTIARAAAYSSAAVVDAPHAELAWQAERELRRAVHRQLSPRERVLAWLHYQRNRAPQLPAGPASWSSSASSSALPAHAGARLRSGRARHRRAGGGRRGRTH